MTATDNLQQSKKRIWLVASPFVCVAAVSSLVVVPWARRLDLHDTFLSSVAVVSATIWLLVLWWSLHHLVFQVAAFFKVSAPSGEGLSQSHTIRFAVMYLTCDDFQPECCRSCVEQTYPADSRRVLICDDGQHAEPVDAFARERPDVTVIRRGNRLGFKAGNLNFAFDHAIDETVEWIVIADADQVLPPDYLSHMARAIEDVPSSVAFVQGAHDSTGETSGSTAPTIFQDALKYDIRLFYQRDMAWRESCGFLPFLGHGAAVSAAAWRSIGGFPGLVSEDYAFALRISASGLKSHYADTVRSFEAFPKDFGAFVVRLKKFAGGSAQLIRREAWRFARSPASRVEKLDVAMLFLWYPLMPLVIANGLLSAFVCSRLWTLGIGALHPALPYVFLGMFILAAPVVRSVTDGYAAASRYWFWSTAVYTATLPMASWSFLRGLVIEPEFQPTPKGDAPTGRFRTAGVMTALLGLVCLNRAVAWWSPFSPLLVGYGVAYLSFPVLFHLHKPGTLGAIARASVFLPGAALIVALLAMWFWGRL